MKLIYLQSDSDGGEIDIFGQPQELTDDAAVRANRIKMANSFLSGGFGEGSYSLYELDVQSSKLKLIASACDGEACWHVDSDGNILREY